MKTTILIGTIVVVLALIFYSIGIITEQRKRIINKTVLSFLSLGLFFDIMATCCMIAGSSKLEFTFHGMLGYSALLLMIIETISAYKFYNANGDKVEVPKKLHLYSRYAYLFWLVAFFTGWAMAAAR